MKYQVVRMVGEEFAVDNFEKSTNDFIESMEVRGYKFVKFNVNTRHRAELQDQPIFASLNGPMYGGPGVVRYEDSAAYDTLSK